LVPNPNPNPNPKIQTLTLTATPNQAWKELGVEEKKQWESQALENRERYTEECRVAGVEPKAFPHALLLPNRCSTPEPTPQP